MRRKDDLKQNSIKKAVIKVVLEEGMHGASISKIAKAAGVSPATVYVYYENKDVMLKDIYLEYAQEMFDYVSRQVTNELPADTFIDVIVRESYYYMVSHEEIHHFVEQFGSCPSLTQGCVTISGPDQLNERITFYKEQGILMNYDSTNIWAMLFYPVKGIVKKRCSSDITTDQRLDEMVQMIQRALIKK